MGIDWTLYPTLATQDVIEVGDFIRARSMTIATGFVTGKGHLGRWKGKPWIPSYSIVDWRGWDDAISVDDAELIHKSDDWWERAPKEYQERHAMSYFLKVGDQFINLYFARKIKQTEAWPPTQTREQALEAGTLVQAVRIEWGDEVATVTGQEAVALVDYLKRSTSDVVEVYHLHLEEIKRLEAEAVAEKAAEAANVPAK